MNETHPHDSPILSAAGEADLVEYGAISPLAVGALLLGAASVLALSGLILLILPIVAVLTALIALQRIARSEGALIGRTAAVVGLALALLFGSLALTQTVVRGWVLRNEARSFGDGWLQLVRDGDLQRAHQLHLPAGERQLASSPLDRFYATNDEARGQLDIFFGTSPLQEIAALPVSAKLRLQNAQTQTYDGFEQVVLRYEVVSNDTSLMLQEFVLVVERAETDAGGVWRAALVSPPRDDESP